MSLSRRFLPIRPRSLTCQPICAARKVVFGFRRNRLSRAFHQLVEPLDRLNQRRPTLVVSLITPAPRAAGPYTIPASELVRNLISASPLASIRRSSSTPPSLTLSRYTVGDIVAGPPELSAIGWMRAITSHAVRAFAEAI